MRVSWSPVPQSALRGHLGGYTVSSQPLRFRGPVVLDKSWWSFSNKLFVAFNRLHCVFSYCILSLPLFSLLVYFPYIYIYPHQHPLSLSSVSCSQVHWWQTQSLLTSKRVPSERQSLTIPGNRNHTMVPGLKPFSEYSLTVNVFNRRGNGPSSSPISFTTPQGGKNASTVDTFWNSVVWAFAKLLCRFSWILHGLLFTQMYCWTQ